MFSSSGDWVRTPQTCAIRPRCHWTYNLSDKMTRCHSTIFIGDVKGLIFRTCVFIFLFVWYSTQWRKSKTKIVPTLPEIMLTKRQKSSFQTLWEISQCKGTNNIPAAPTRLLCSSLKRSVPHTMRRRC